MKISKEYTIPSSSELKQFTILVKSFTNKLHSKRFRSSHRKKTHSWRGKQAIRWAPITRRLREKSHLYRGDIHSTHGPSSVTMQEWAWPGVHSCSRSRNMLIARIHLVVLSSGFGAWLSRQLFSWLSREPQGCSLTSISTHRYPSTCLANLISHRVGHRTRQISLSLECKLRL